MSVLNGLPGQLPEGERLLWQGAPDTKVLARRVFQVRKIAVYFGVIVLWMAVMALRDGSAPMEAAVSLSKAVGMASIPLVLIYAYAWIVARMTVYTITNQRVAMRVGVALPLTINLPFTRIAGADVDAKADGTGSIALSLTGTDRVAYAILWPHARPWRFSKSEPMLRGLRDVAPVANILARALAASAGMAAPVVMGGVDAAAPGVNIQAAA